MYGQQYKSSISVRHAPSPTTIDHLASADGMDAVVRDAGLSSSVALAPLGHEIIEFNIAGFRYHEGLEIMPYLQPGELVDLTAEPGNPHDPCAVRIEHKRSRIGYVPRACNQRLSELLQADVTLYAQIARANADALPWEAVTVRVTIEAGNVVQRSG